jgi:hypothetical protein
MADEDDDIVVTIEDEPSDTGLSEVEIQDETTGAAAAQQAKPQKAQEPDDIVGTLKAQLETLQVAKDEATQRAASAESIAGQATQRAAEAEQKANAAGARVQESHRVTLQSGIAAAKSASDSAQKELESAFEAGNGKGVAEANRKIARAEADLATLEQALHEMPVRRETTQPVQQQTVQKPASGDPVEGWIGSLSGKSQAWVRDHMDYARDQRKNLKLNAAHMDAVAEGVTVDSPEYFEHVERFLGMKKPVEQQAAAGTGTTQRRPSSVVAPVTQSGGALNGGKRKVMLTRGERDAATDGTHVWNYDDPKRGAKKGEPIGIHEMARRKEIMTKQERYTKNVNIDGT